MTREQLWQAFKDGTPVNYTIKAPSGDSVFPAKRIDALYYRRSAESPDGVILCAEIVSESNCIVKVASQNVSFR